MYKEELESGSALCPGYGLPPVVGPPLEPSSLLFGGPGKVVSENLKNQQSSEILPEPNKCRTTRKGEECPEDKQEGLRVAAFREQNTSRAAHHRVQY